MTGTQRIKAMMEGKKMDRPGVALWGPHFDDIDHYLEDFVEAQINYQERWNFDFMKVMFNGDYFAEAYGQTRRSNEGWNDSYFGNAMKFVINDPHEWEKLKPLDAHKGTFGRLTESIKRLADHFKGDVPILPTVFSSVAWAEEIAGEYIRPEIIVSNITYSEKSFRKGLEVLQESNANLMNAMVEAGADGFFFCQRTASSSILPHDMFLEFGMKPDLELLNMVGSRTWFNVMHLHAERNAYIDDILKYPVQGINWEDQGELMPSIAEMRKKTDMILIGGLDNCTDLLGPDRDKVKEVTKAKVLEAIKQAGDDKLVISGGCAWQERSPRRFPVLWEVVNEIAAERAGK